MRQKRLTPIKAIRAKCMECSGGSFKEVRECHITDCALHPYRLGKNPARKGQGFAKRQTASKKGFLAQNS